MSDATAVEGLEYAGFWVRFWATMIDLVLSSLIVSPIVNAVYRGSAPGSSDNPAQMLNALSKLAGDPLQFLNAALSTLVRGPLDAFISLGLPTIAIIVFWIYKSATPGKMLLHARIVDERTGGALTAGQSIGRYLGYYVSICTLFIGFLWVAFDPRKQGFHDKLAGTVVIRKRRNAAADFKGPPPPVNPG
ncbi:MAG TPA: RDD family protein [Steroidobacteraceae bacterium]|nr:RDD family protein [Steroidobacteraceae bacterium]